MSVGVIALADAGLISVTLSYEELLPSTLALDWFWLLDDWLWPCFWLPPVAVALPPVAFPPVAVEDDPAVAPAFAAEDDVALFVSVFVFVFVLVLVLVLVFWIGVAVGGLGVWH
jgi:hypothetical protein